MNTFIKRLLTASFLTLILSLLVAPGFRSHIFFLNFVDEDDNIVIGNLAGEGKKLYTDVYTQHQPIMFYLSAGIEKVVKPDNILMTVKRHREFMIVWSFLWIFILIYRFGLPLFFASAVIELMKINLLGNLFLAESFVVYPLIYLISYLVYKNQKKIDWETWTVVSLIWFLWFTLAPIWPLLGAMFLWMIYKTKSRIVMVKIISIIGSGFFLLFFGRGGFLDYWHDVIYINYKYYIPLTTSVGFFESGWKGFLAPVYALTSSNQSVLLGFIKVLSLGFIVELIWLIKDKLHLRLLAWIALLGLSNLRYIDPSNTLYGAFHMLPWLSLLLMLNIVELKRLLKGNKAQIATAMIIFLAIGWSALSTAMVSIFDKRDVTTDFYVNYSPLVDIHKVVQILNRDSEQTIWVEPVGYWPYWRTGAEQYSEMVNYYGWMDQTPPMKESLDKQFQQELPTIVWAETSLGIGKYLGEYVRVERDGKPINLYLRKDKVGAISKESREELDYYRFKIN